MDGIRGRPPFTDSDRAFVKSLGNHIFRLSGRLQEVPGDFQFRISQLSPFLRMTLYHWMRQGYSTNFCMRQWIKSNEGPAGSGTFGRSNSDAFCLKLLKFGSGK
ncbi:uncharacterized protein CEXT_104711 [Caerostris extrusa]|uniref:Uncharacterized protein n=1 Tax=Caerostris extrusa TaxID=172846 RepID=A0AAV4MLV2_CAEEX|nr:uncharacterized protein CEXT_104711 [Caerostris extrusa]